MKKIIPVFISRSPAMQRVVEDAQYIAARMETLESLTGKDFTGECIEIAKTTTMSHREVADDIYRRETERLA